MSKQTIPAFESAVADSYAWLNAIEDDLGYEDKHVALQGLRGVLHALRDRLTIDQNAHLSAQLPLLIRGLYFENWDPQPVPDRDRSLEGFLAKVGTAMAGYPGLEMRDVVTTVFLVLRRHITGGEADKIVKALPHQIAVLWHPEPSY